MSRWPATWLYVATGENGVRKLGSTAKPQSRVKMLREAYWQTFTLDRTWHRPEADGRLIEHIAHALLKPYRDPARELCWELYRAPLETIYKAVDVAIEKAANSDLSDLSKSSSFVKTWRNPAKLAAYQQWQRDWAAKLAAGTS